MVNPKENIVVWRHTGTQWLLTAIAAILLVVIFYDGIAWMVGIWSGKEEYGYGFLIPVISAFFIWSRKDRLERLEFRGSWAGVVFLVAGLGLFILGDLSTVYVVVEYAFVVVLISMVLAAAGWQAFREIWVPLLLLLFMIPFPQFLYQNLSGKLQLISSGIGVAFIRMFDISVYLEGNVIDLGNFKLQVVEACSGLRYLFPLASLAFIAAYIYRAAFWKRAVIFLSSVPVTILMNSLRIGLIGILVDNWGISQAEGFLHYFEGWVIFMACMAILLLEMWLLARIGHGPRSLGDIFAVELPARTPDNATIRSRKTVPQHLVSVVLLASAVVFASSIAERNELIPEHRSFADFPVSIDDWTGSRGALESIYIDALKFDDYLLSDYSDSSGNMVNLYIAYYASQRKGQSAHSPRTCIPGGGWRIESLENRELPAVMGNGSMLNVNRVLIQKGDDRQLVYYWFQQRGRDITSEYLVKWYLFWDALVRNRTDGALVRLSAVLAPNEEESAADRRLTDFAVSVSPILKKYIPD